MAAQQEGKMEIPESGRRCETLGCAALSSDQVRAPPPVLMLPSTQPPSTPPVSDRDASNNPSGIVEIPDSGEPKLTPAMELVSGKKRKPMPSFLVVIVCGQGNDSTLAAFSWMNSE